MDQRRRARTSRPKTGEVSERRYAVTTASRLAAIVEFSDDAIVGKELDGTITSWNQGAVQTFGYRPEEIVGASVLELVPEDRRDEELRILETVATGKGIQHLETLRRRKDGALIHVSITSSPIRDASGRVVGASMLARDITHRKHAEAALRASEDRYRTLFDHAPDGILIADTRSYYIDANPSMCRMLGYTRDELIGLHATDIVAPEETPHIDPALATIEQRHEYHREWLFRRRDGSTFPADVLATKMPDDTILAVVRDATERKRALEALRAADERMRFALENSGVGIWEIDYTSGSLKWSETLEAQYGLAPGTFEGTFDAFIDRVHPDDRPSVLETLNAAARRGGDYSIEHRVVWPDGSIHRLTEKGRILLSPSGAPLRGVGISLDVTERHQLEAQYLQAQKMEAVGRLAGGIAHDFNNLLTAILGYCELLLASLNTADPLRADVGEIQKAATTAAALTEQLLAFSRKTIIEPRPLDLNVVIAGMRDMLRRLIGEDVTLVTKAAPRPAVVQADKTQVEQIVLNLAVNARDAMPAGGTLTIEVRHVQLDEHYAASHFSVRPGAYVALIVSDTGVGMSPEVQSHLFEPFFTTKALGKGTGLGLATVHGIVTRSGGTVGVYSELGKGTSFNVYFPTATEEPVTSEPSPAAAGEPGPPLTVLVVEDEENLRNLTRRLLERQGFTVLLAANADEALRIVGEGHPIDVLLTDVVMPGASGPALTKQLIEQRPELKVVFMSGYTEDTIVHHGVLRPGVVFLHKPFTSATLTAKIREVLDRS